MSLSTLIKTYTAYNSWANERIVQWLGKYPKELLHKELPSSYHTLLLTLQHISVAEMFWLNVIQENKVEYNKVEKDLEHFTLFDTLKYSAIFNDYVQSLSETDLGAPVELDASWSKATKPRFSFIQHCMNHSAYHRGQVITMGRTLGMADPPNTDFNTFSIPIEGL